MTTTPTRGERLQLRGQLVTVEVADRGDTGVQLLVRHPDGTTTDEYLSWTELDEARVVADDGSGRPSAALAGLWGHWMSYIAPRLRAGALATRPLDAYAHQDEAVFDWMLPQPRLRFLLADEPGTGKTIMTGMYLVEGRRRGLVLGASVVVVPAHLLRKWQSELNEFFGIDAHVVTAQVAADPLDLDPRVDVWLVSVDLYARNADVRRKIAGPSVSWSLAVFDEAHRLTPTSRYLEAASELATRSHHLLLLTATPHRGNEHFFRGLLHLLDPDLYPWLGGPTADYEGKVRPSRLTFLRRMKEDLRLPDGSALFPARFAHMEHVPLQSDERSVYDSVMSHVEAWYGADSTLALSIYGKRAASSLVAIEQTLRRRLEALRGAARNLGSGILPDGFADALDRRDVNLSSAFDDPDDLDAAEQTVVTARSRDKQREADAVVGLLTMLGEILDGGYVPAKWEAAQSVVDRHGIAPGSGQLLVFSEFTDTARWLVDEFRRAGYTAEILHGEVPPDDRHDLQRRFLAGEYQVLVSTDAGGEGINLQSAHVMINWDIPWSLVRLEQRMGRLHRIGQRRDVHVHHLVAPYTREARVQERLLENLSEAAETLQGRIFDVLDTAVTEGAGFDLARAMADAQTGRSVVPPDAATLRSAVEQIEVENRRLRSHVDVDAAAIRFREDRIEAINPVIVDGFLDAVAQARDWRTSPGPATGIRRLDARRGLPDSFGGSRSALVASSGDAVRAAISAGASGLDDVVVLGPAEDAFADLVELALSDGSRELVRGARLVDSASASGYQLLVFDATVALHDGVRSVRRRAPVLVRRSSSEAFAVSWEVVMNLRPALPDESVAAPGPAARSEGANAASMELTAEVERERLGRLEWVDRARQQLAELDDVVRDETEHLDTNERRDRRRRFRLLRQQRQQQLDRLDSVTNSAPRLVGWAAVEAGVRVEDLGYDPDSERVAVGVVWTELESLGFDIEDRQTAGVGYDLLARHRTRGEVRHVEVKGQTDSLGPVFLEQNEWAQALQRGDAYWLYVVSDCGTTPTVRVRVKDPARVFGDGNRAISRFQIPVSSLREHVEQ